MFLSRPSGWSLQKGSIWVCVPNNLLSRVHWGYPHLWAGAISGNDSLMRRSLDLKSQDQWPWPWAYHFMYSDTNLTKLLVNSTKSSKIHQKSHKLHFSNLSTLWLRQGRSEKIRRAGSQKNPCVLVYLASIGSKTHAHAYSLPATGSVLLQWDMGKSRHFLRSYWTPRTSYISSHTETLWSWCLYQPSLFCKWNRSLAVLSNCEGHLLGRVRSKVHLK